MWRITLLIMLGAFGVRAQDEPLVAISTLQTDASAEPIAGTLTFTQQDDGQVLVQGIITGMAAGLYGFHIHELGDLSNGCTSTLGHFDLSGNNHGGQDQEVRHIGDLGNVRFDADEEANITILDPLLALTGPNSILGRSVVLHAQEDDLGLGGHADSLTTGNAGPRAACGVIGKFSPAGAWPSSSATAALSFGAVLVAAFISSVKYFAF